MLTFQTAPDYESPTDVASTTPMNAAGNNEYIVEVTATSGTGTRELTTAQVITVTVTNEHPPGTIVALSVSDTTVDESDGTFDVTVTATTERDEAFNAGFGFAVNVVGRGDTARVGSDYEAVSENVLFGQSDFTRGGSPPVWTAVKTFQVTLIDDTDEEAEETFSLVVERGPGTPQAIKLDEDHKTIEVTIAKSDAVAPELVADPDGVVVEGDEVVLTYDEDLDETSDSTPPTTAFTLGGTTATVSAVAVSGPEVTLTLSAAVGADDTVTLTYTVPAVVAGTSGPIQDRIGEQAAGITSKTATNRTNRAPSFTSNAAFSVAEDTDTADDITGYSLTGGVDQLKFSIDSGTGVLTFQTAPDYENPADVASTTPMNAAGNNEYIVEVTATSGTGARVMTTAQVITVTVTNVVTESAATLSVATIGSTTMITEGQNGAFEFDVDPKPSASTKYTVTFDVTETDAMVDAADKGTGKTQSFVWHAGHSCWTNSFTATAGDCGEGPETYVFGTTDDMTEEDDSVVTLTMTGVTAVDSSNSAVTAPSLASPAFAVITVEDLVPLTVSIADASASESAGEIAFSVSLSRAHLQDVMVTWTASDGTATQGTHYTGTTGTLTIKDGETHGTLSLPVVDDTANNAARTFTVTLSNPMGGAALDTGHTTATGTILDDEGSGAQDIDIWIEDGALVESDSDGMMQFAVKLSETYPWREITVDYTTSPGTATAGEDYTAKSGTLTFPAREGCCDPIEVPIINDSEDEDKTETFTVTLSDPQGAALTGASATGTIYDEDIADTGIELHIDVWAEYLNDDGTIRFYDDNTFMVQFIFQHPARPFEGIAVTGFDATDVTVTPTNANTRTRFIAPTGTGITGQFANMEVTPGNTSSFDITIEVAAKAATGTGDYATAGNEAASLQVLSGQEVPQSLSARAAIDVVITAPTSKKQGRIARDADGGFDVDISFVDPTQPVVGIPVTDFTPDDVEVTGGRAAREFSDESYQGAAYRLRIFPDRGADEVTVTVPTGVAEAKDDASNINAEGSETFALAEADSPVREAPDPLTAGFEGLPSSHDGGSFGFRIAFSEDIDADADDLRDHALTVSGGAVTEAARVDGRKDLWRFTVAPSGGDDIEIELSAGRDCAEPGAICTSDGRQLSSGLAGAVEGPPALTAAFRSVPEAPDGTSAFDVRVAFSEAIGASYVTLRDEAFTVTGGGVTGAHRVDGRNDLWEITVTPDAREEITITLPGGRACGTTGALCTGGDHPRPLSNSPSATVAGPPLEPLTASFDGVPAEHMGERFTFGLTLSEEPHGEFSYTTLRDHAFAVRGGTVYGASRRQQGTNRRWTIHIDPSGRDPVTVRLPATSDCNASGAICTEDSRPLSHALSATVIGPAGLSVADAEAEETVDETIVFTVTLDRAASGTVTVDYATADGSATAGADYTAARGTLRFQAGERTKTVAVTLLDDTHDEGEETFTLTLSKASGAVIVDGEATGTIENHDPLPRALLARFGRTAAVHVVEHVEERIAAPREPGFRGRFAGQELRKGMARDAALGVLSRLGASAGVSPAGVSPAGGGVHGPMSGLPGVGAASVETPGRGGARMGMAGSMGPMMGVGAGPGALGSMRTGTGPDGGLTGRGLLDMGLGSDSLITGSAFSLNRETGSGGILSFWSRGAQSSFFGREGDLSLDGRVRTTMFGADYATGPLVTGLSLAHSRGRGGYSGVGAGEVTSSVTGLYPWLGYRVTDRITLWGVTGYGKGALRLTPGEGTTLKSGLSMAMAASGLRGELADSVVGGFGLAFKADALWVGTGIEGVDGPAGRLAATSAAVTRFRTGLEASRGYRFKHRLSLEPSLEVGLRRDGGDAETGAGVDLGGGLFVSDPMSGLSADVRVRMLLVHQDAGFRERGVSVSFSYDPTPRTPLGFLARVSPSWGGQATSGAEALWGRETMAGMAHGGAGAGNRLQAELGYGLPVGSRFVGTPRFGIGTSESGRDYRLGYGMTVFESGAMNFDLGVDANRRVSPGREGAEHGFQGRLTVRW